jgi:hypothetical protein
MEGYVYLIGTPVFRWYKIGKSKTPEVRVSNLGILLPFKIDVIAVWKAANHTKMEAALHEMYASNRINGEWFEFSAKEAYAVMNKIPSETRVYPVEGIEHILDRFSNVVEDTRKGKEVIGVKVRKLRGDFTDEERELLKHESMRVAAENKALGLTLKGKPKRQVPADK